MGVLESVWNFTWGVVRFVLPIALALGILFGIIYGLVKVAEFIAGNPEEAADRVCINIDNLIDGYANVTLAEAVETCDRNTKANCKLLLEGAQLIENRCSDEFCDAYTSAIQCFCRGCGCFKECEQIQSDEVGPKGVCAAVCDGTAELVTTVLPEAGI